MTKKPSWPSSEENFEKEIEHLPHSAFDVKHYQTSKHLVIGRQNYSKSTTTSVFKNDRRKLYHEIWSELQEIMEEERVLGLDSQLREAADTSSRHEQTGTNCIFVDDTGGTNCVINDTGRLNSCVTERPNFIVDDTGRLNCVINNDTERSNFVVDDTGGLNCVINNDTDRLNHVANDTDILNCVIDDTDTLYDRLKQRSATKVESKKRSTGVFYSASSKLVAKLGTSASVAKQLFVTNNRGCGCLVEKKEKKIGGRRTEEKKVGKKQEEREMNNKRKTEMEEVKKKEEEKEKKTEENYVEIVWSGASLLVHVEEEGGGGGKEVVVEELSNCFENNAVDDDDVAKKGYRKKKKKRKTRRNKKKKKKKRLRIGGGEEEEQGEQLLTGDGEEDFVGGGEGGEEDERGNVMDEDEEEEGGGEEIRGGGEGEDESVEEDERAEDIGGGEEEKEREGGGGDKEGEEGGEGLENIVEPERKQKNNVIENVVDESKNKLLDKKLCVRIETPKIIGRKSLGEIEHEMKVFYGCLRTKNQNQLICDSVEVSNRDQLICGSVEISNRDKLICGSVEISNLAQLICESVENSSRDQLICESMELRDQLICISSAYNEECCSSIPSITKHVSTIASDVGEKLYERTVTSGDVERNYVWLKDKIIADKNNLKTNGLFNFDLTNTRRVKHPLPLTKRFRKSTSSENTINHNSINERGKKVLDVGRARNFTEMSGIITDIRPSLQDDNMDDAIVWYCAKCQKFYNLKEVDFKFPKTTLIAHCRKKCRQANGNRHIKGQLMFEFLIENSRDGEVCSYFLVNQEAEAFFECSAFLFWTRDDVKLEVKKCIERLLRCQQKRLLSRFCVAENVDRKFIVNVKRRTEQ
ncbi:hypothetical protein LSTR_LSTR014057 [Laodelphax striatellus]|uniref:Uncharacterized protein n=1 Tax=Laodelphax striatellus TaxID=195883 RepID=A0A482XVS3_LAOST|nr:hypothetical protein LSTR_LSTR014057 [Laodelphax striatellus]